MTDVTPPSAGLKRTRILLWALVALAISGAAALFLIRGAPVNTSQTTTTGSARIGGPFTLVDGDGNPFSSVKLSGKPYVIYFGFTRCADACPITLSRLIKLRRESANDRAMNILFVTIDPTFDGPSRIGQYAKLFNAPVIGLTGSPEQIERIKKQYGVYGAPNPHPTPGDEMVHTTTALLFDRDGKFVTTIAPDEPDSSALDKIKRLIA